MRQTGIFFGYVHCSSDVINNELGAHLSWYNWNIQRRFSSNSLISRWWIFVEVFRFIQFNQDKIMFRKDSYYLIGRIIMGRLGEYDFHITTLMIFHICCICQKKISTYENGWTIEWNNNFWLYNHEETSKITLLVKTC